MTKPSPFAQALRELLFSIPDKDRIAASKDFVEHWTLWLNPWYAGIGADGKPNGRGSIIPMPPGGDMEEATDEEMRAWRDDIARNWTPQHRLGVGVTTAHVEKWLNDEDAPSDDQISRILGYFECSRRTAAMQAALDGFDAVMQLPSGQATPFARNFMVKEMNVGSIGAAVFLERYGIVWRLAHLPYSRWEGASRDVVRAVRDPESKTPSAGGTDDLVLRRTFWLRHGHAEALYGDDGEMQCNACGIDFKRMTPAEIEHAFDEIVRIKQLTPEQRVDELAHLAEKLRGRKESR